ncbi:MAG: MetQ/NlpA family ABC transporter substrate-binding protein [Dialister sp.]|uniref:MetQ/NlpA family ABC transporter substrate-binding protein n=1 Tax=Dialister sp. TaxID=1955814 RepID=UPI00257E9B28|nr:MetQ/NlpA family ABC transporter substrate-binding protein [Dialister sp.]MBS6413438.1 MetQ/NlpA family ABC transporter substrate-binding protein [Dialister sp.]
MKLKTTIALSLAAIAFTGVISGCGGDKKPAASSAAVKNEISVGITPGYSEQVMEYAAKEAAKQGLTVNIKTFSDYVTPDQALAAGDIDLNSFQHGPFLQAFNEKNGTHLVSIGNTYLAPLRVYSNKITSIKDVPDGAKVSIPNDPSNGGRALLLLDHNGLLKLKPGTDPTKATINDIAENPKKLEIIELEAAQLPRSLDDVTISVINAGYAKSANLDSKKALATEDNTSPYVNIIAAREQDKDNPTYQKFVKIFQSDNVRKYINDNFSDGLVPAF